MKIAFVVFSLAVASAAASAAAQPGPEVQFPTLPVTLSASQTAAARAAVTSELNDPDSARFGPMRAGRLNRFEPVIVCGHVNARNRFGGFVGMTPFQLKIEGNRVFDLAIGDSGAIHEAITLSCRNYGLVPQ